MSFITSGRTGIELPHSLLIYNKHQTKGSFDSKFAAMHVPFMWLFGLKILFKYSGPRKKPLWKLVLCIGWSYGRKPDLASLIMVCLTRSVKLSSIRPAPACRQHTEMLLTGSSPTLLRVNGNIPKERAN